MRVMPCVRCAINCVEPLVTASEDLPAGIVQKSEGLTFLDPKLKGTVAITYEETACSPLLAWAACF